MKTGLYSPAKHSRSKDCKIKESIYAYQDRELEGEGGGGGVVEGLVTIPHEF